LFRLGARKRAKIVWNDAVESVAAAAAFVRHQLQDWKIAADLAGSVELAHRGRAQQEPARATVRS